MTTEEILKGLDEYGCQVVEQKDITTNAIKKLTESQNIMAEFNTTKDGRKIVVIVKKCMLCENLSTNKNVCESCYEKRGFVDIRGLK